MRRLFTTAASGFTKGQLHWGEQTGRWRRIRHGVYGEGPEEPSALDRARASALVSPPARGTLAGVLYQLDGVELSDEPRRRDAAVAAIELGGVPCVSAPQTLVDLASILDDDRWEQALECALRKRLVTIAELEALPRWTRGMPRIKRVLALRPAGAPPTESLLETLMVQLVRRVPGLGEPVRQYRVVRADGEFVARLDLCWPELGLFIELDGQGHKDQPVYDARRQTAVTAVTGWLCGRFTWREVTRIPRTTARRLAELAEQARRRRPAA